MLFYMKQKSLLCARDLHCFSALSCARPVLWRLSPAGPGAPPGVSWGKQVKVIVSLLVTPSSVQRFWLSAAVPLGPSAGLAGSPGSASPWGVSSINPLCHHRQLLLPAQSCAHCLLSTPSDACPSTYPEALDSLCSD